MCLQCLRKMNNEDGQFYSVCKLQFSCFTSTTVRININININKQNVSIADENLTDYGFFFCRYHFTKSKNYLKDDI